MPTRIEEKYCVTKNSLGFNYLYEKVCEKSRWYLFSLYNFIQNRSKTIAYFTRKSIRPLYYYGYILQYRPNICLLPHTIPYAKQIVTLSKIKFSGS